LCCLSFFFWLLCCLSFFFWPLCCLSFLLRFTASDYPFGIFKHFYIIEWFRENFSGIRVSQSLVSCVIFCIRNSLTYILEKCPFCFVICVVKMEMKQKSPQKSSSEI
jgi:hypothetical protein